MSVCENVPVCEYCRYLVLVLSDWAVALLLLWYWSCWHTRYLPLLVFAYLGRDASACKLSKDVLRCLRCSVYVSAAACIYLRVCLVCLLDCLCSFRLVCFWISPDCTCEF